MPPCSGGSDRHAVEEQRGAGPPLSSPLLHLYFSSRLHTGAHCLRCPIPWGSSPCFPTPLCVRHSARRARPRTCSLTHLPPPPPPPPRKVFGGHRTEGYALDWSPSVAGRLASGDCRGGLHLWEPAEGGAKWKVGACLPGLKASVEDVQWSPSEKDVFIIGAERRGEGGLCVAGWATGRILPTCDLRVARTMCR